MHVLIFIFQVNYISFILYNPCHEHSLTPDFIHVTFNILKLNISI